MLVLAFLIAAAAAAPASYDQRQDGDLNVRADVQNIVFLVAVPEKLSLPASIYGLLKNAKQNHESEIQDRSDVHVMEAFVEPSEPYHVEIGESTRNADGDGRAAVEVVIAGRRRLEAEPALEAEAQPALEPPGDRDEYKLIGATEQCGPDAERDPVSLTCRARSQPAAADAAPALALAPSDQPDDQLQQITVQQPSPELVPAST